MELGTEEFTKITVKILQEIQDVPEIVLENPKAGSVSPVYVVQSPIEIIEKVDILKRFSIVVEGWAKKKYDAYKLSDTASKKLRDYNYIKTSTPIDLYDEITGCYRYGASYEVCYNVLTGTLERIK